MNVRILKEIHRHHFDFNVYIKIGNVIEKGIKDVENWLHC